MHVRSATKVGLAVLTSIAIFTLVSFFLLGRGFRASRYPLDVVFKDAQNVTPGADVLMAGVRIGTVQKIALDGQNRAVMHLLIDKEYKVPQGSQFIVTAGGFIGEKYVSILPKGANPALAEGSTITGRDTVKIEDLLAKANDLAASSNQVIREAQLALQDSRVMIRSVSKMIQDPALRQSLYATMQNVQAASRNVQSATVRADQMASDFASLSHQEKPRVDRMMAALEASSTNFQSFTEGMNGLINGKDLKSDLGETFHNFREASAQLPLVTAHLQQITANLEKFSGDPEMIANLKTTLANVRAASDQSLQTTQAINQAVQRLTARYRRTRNASGTNDTPARANAVLQHSSADVLQSVDPGHFRLDLNTVFPIGQNQFLYGGVRGLGEENRLNLQMGQTLNGDWSTRYGIYDGRLGIGLDQNLSGTNGLSLNLYDPNRLKADLYARKRLTPNASLMIGVEKIFQNPTPTLGVRIRH